MGIMEKVKQNPRGVITIAGVTLVAMFVIFWPQSPDSWSAWGTWLGAVGTILAVVYAARTLKTTSEAQLEESRDRRATMDFLELQEAEEAGRLRLSIKSVKDGSAQDATDAFGAYILLRNVSANPFSEIQVSITEESLLTVGPLRNLNIEKSVLVDDQPTVWSCVEKNPASTLAAGQHHYTLGTVRDGECLKLSFNFTTPEMAFAWNGRWMNSKDPLGCDPEKLISITFKDRNHKRWKRTSRDGGLVQRLIV